MKKLVLTAVLVLTIGICGLAHAALLDRGNGAIYDTDLDITWHDSIYLGPEGSGATWEQARAWTDALEIWGSTEWRLPLTPGTGTGYRVEGEIGYLFYNTLGNSAGGPFTNSAGLFENLVTTKYYWTVTDFGLDGAYFFNLANGWQGHGLKTNLYYALAVHDGDVGAGAPFPGDFAPADCDIDGSDLAFLIVSPRPVGFIKTFAHNFGKTTTVGCSIY
jgi:hypothetical protein